jgi:ribosomal-protein-alanine N-acetyltransferase
LDAVVEYSVDEAVAAYQDWPSHTAEAAKAFLDRALTEAEQSPRVGYGFAVVELSTSFVIGDVSIGIASVPNQRAEIGYTLRRDRWGQGLATEAARLLLAFGFDELGMHRIEANTHPANIASARVLEKIGMSYEGRIRDHLLVQGAWRDSLSYSILEPEWRSSLWTR